MYNHDTKRVIMKIYVEWVDSKITDPAENPKMFRKAQE